MLIKIYIIPKQIVTILGKKTQHNQSNLVNFAAHLEHLPADMRLAFVEFSVFSAYV